MPMPNGYACERAVRRPSKSTVRLRCSAAQGWHRRFCESRGGVTQLSTRLIGRLLAQYDSIGSRRSRRRRPLLPPHVTRRPAHVCVAVVVVVVLSNGDETRERQRETA